MRRPWILPMTILLVTSGSAGCLEGSGAGDGPGNTPGTSWVRGPDTPRPDFDFSGVIEDTHNHADPALHHGGYAIDFVGYSQIVAASDATTPSGGHAEVAVAAGYAFVANWGPQRGLSIIDVSDPANPVHVSDLAPNRFKESEAPGAGSYWDVSVTEDGNLTILSAQALAMVPLPGREAEHGGGVYLVNTEDKHNPYVESFTQVIDGDALIPVGVHNARPFTVDGVLHVAATTANGQTYLYRVLGQAPSRTLELLSSVPGMHDTTVQVHPVTGETLIYGAQGGVFITDITDPSDPVIISFTANSAGLSAYHQVVPNNVLVDGVHYTIAATESSNGNPTPFTILDTTDPYDPVVVGRWILPGDPDPQGQPYRFSGHNVDVHDGRMYIGHYHAGVWVVDFASAAHAAEPFAVGYYLPHESLPNAPRTLMGVDVPSVWAVVVGDDGLLYASDVNSGLYILEFTGPPSPFAGAPEWPTNIR